MPEGTPFVRPSSERSRELVRQRIADGRWTVDVEAGVVHGERGQALRGKRNTSGYVQYSFRDPDDYQQSVCVSGHLVIWEHVHGPVPHPMQVNHLNGVKDDNRIANLELLTPTENIRHAHRTGLIPRTLGDTSTTAKLDAVKVRHIRTMLADGHPMRECAERYGVSIPVIRDVKWRKTWKWVTDEDQAEEATAR